MWPDDVGPSDVFVVGSEHDEHLDAVVEELRRRNVQPQRIDVDRAAGAGVFRDLPGESPERSCRAVMCRSLDTTGSVAHHNDRTVRRTETWSMLPPKRRAFAAREFRMALLGWLDSLRPNRWLNHPWDAQRAEVKSTQLREAKRCGLPTPRTLISDDPVAVARFAQAMGGDIVYKTLDVPVTWEKGDNAGFLYASVVDEHQFQPGQPPLSEPGIFQERLDAVGEYRLTVVGERVFVARTVRERADVVDWRRDLASGLRFEPGKLDVSVTEAAVRVVSAFGLRYAALDLIQTPEGIYFLELNPSGAYLWLEKSLGFRITEAICDDVLAPT